MSGVLGSKDVLLPFYALRVRTKHGKVFKRDICLVSRNEQGSLLEIKKLFDERDSEDPEDSWETYYLIKSNWKLPICKGSDMIIEEARLEIKKEERWNWSVKRVDNFVKVS